jgi:hypothetical protein
MRSKKGKAKPREECPAGCKDCPDMIVVDGKYLCITSDVCPKDDDPALWEEAH